MPTKTRAAQPPHVAAPAARARPVRAGSSRRDRAGGAGLGGAAAADRPARQRQVGAAQPRGRRARPRSPALQRQPVVVRRPARLPGAQRRARRTASTCARRQPFGARNRCSWTRSRAAGPRCRTSCSRSCTSGARWASSSTALRYRWAAMNPPAAFDDAGDLDDAYLGSQPLDPALADRFAFVVALPALADIAPEQRKAADRARRRRAGSTATPATAALPR